LPQTPPVQITYFPKDRARSHTIADDPFADERTKTELEIEISTDPSLEESSEEVADLVKTRIDLAPAFAPEPEADPTPPTGLPILSQAPTPPSTPAVADPEDVPQSRRETRKIARPTTGKRSRTPTQDVPAVGHEHNVLNSINVDSDAEGYLREALTYHRSKLEKLLRGDRRALEGLDQNEMLAISTFGHRLYEEGRLNEARVVFEGLVAMEPHEAFPYTVLGAIFMAQHDLHRALALFEAALEFDPEDPAALCYRGEIRLEMGQRSKGLADLRLAIELDSDASPFAQRARSTLDSLGEPIRPRPQRRR
jgi:tetratricopeptide (TPR) repeat protein